MKFTLFCLLSTSYLCLCGLLTGNLIQRLVGQPIPFAVRAGLGYAIFGFLIPLGLTSILSHRIVGYIHVLFMISLVFYFWKNNTKFFTAEDLPLRLIFVFFSVSYLVFMAPSWSVPGGGAFSAGGGDITIYSTQANQVPDDSLMSRGSWSNLFNFVLHGRKPAETQASPGPLYPGNAPFPNWTGYRMHHHVGSSFYLQGWIMPMGFLTHIFPGIGIAAIYFGVLAFLYSLSLLFFAEFAWIKSKNIQTTILSYFLPLASYGFVYPAYNHYYPSFASSFFLLTFIFFLLSSKGSRGILTLSILLNTCILLQNWPVTPFYGVAIVAAMILLKKSQFFTWKAFGNLKFILFSLAVMLITLPMIQTALDRLMSFMHNGAVSAMSIEYLGMPRKWFSWGLIQATFGYLQLNNLPPYTLNLFSLRLSTHLICIIGIACALSLFFYSSKQKNSRHFTLLFFFIFFLCFVSGIETEYTQFKGISYALPLFFVALSVALAEVPTKNKRIFALGWIFGLSLLFLHLNCIKEFYQHQYPTNVVSINLPKILEQADPDNKSVFIIYPPAPPSIYLIDTLVLHRKYLLAREYSYHELNSGSVAEMLSAYGINQFQVAYEKTDHNWQVEPLLTRLSKNKFEIIGIHYEVGFANNIEIIVAPFQRLSLTISKEDTEKTKVLLWNNDKKAYVVTPASEKNNLQWKYALSTRANWGAIRIPGSVKLQIKAED